MAEDGEAGASQSMQEKSDKDPAPSMDGDGEKTFSCLNCPIILWFVMYLGLGVVSLSILMLCSFLAAVAFLILTFLFWSTGRLPLKWANRCLLFSIVLTIIGPFLYYGYQDAIDFLYVIPTKEYDPLEERGAWAFKYQESSFRTPEEKRDAYIRYHGYLKESKPVSLDNEATFQIESGHPRLDGATALAGIYRSFARTAYKGDYNYESLVRCSRALYAYEALITGETDMIFVFRPSEKQIQVAAEKGIKLRIIPIGYDAFVFFVNDKNPVTGLTTEQLRSIYSGKIIRWSEVGGSYFWKVIPYQRGEGSGSQSRMLQFMGETPLLTAKNESRLFFTRIDAHHTARYHNYRGAIGYSFLYFVDQMMLSKGIKLLEINGVPPTLDSIRNGTYPLTEEICVVTAGSDNPNVEPFIEWMLSPQGQELVEKVGFIPIKSRGREPGLAHGE